MKHVLRCPNCNHALLVTLEVTSREEKTTYTSDIPAHPHPAPAFTEVECATCHQIRPFTQWNAETGEALCDECASSIREIERRR